MNDAVAILVAAGRGRRAGGNRPKPFRPLAGRFVLDWSVRVLCAHPRISRVLVLVPEDHLHAARTIVSGLEDVEILSGGETRVATVGNALLHLRRSPPARVLIHDAARPGLFPEIIDRVLNALGDRVCAAPAIAVADSLVRRDDNGRLESIGRQGLHRVQTPQAFAFEPLAKAMAELSATGNTPEHGDETSLMRAAGFETAIVQGDARLAKITWEEDFAVLEHLLAPGAGLDAVPRIGIGYDVHAFGDGDHVTLCGERIAHDRALVGHSDADVGFHAIADALFGALGDGDLGSHFPNSDPRWKGTSSDRFIDHARRLAETRGYAVANVDVTLICQAPRIAPHREAMRTAVAALLGCAIERVGIKATTTEGLGSIGRGEGIAAQAAVILVRDPGHGT